MSLQKSWLLLSIWIMIHASCFAIDPVITEQPYPAATVFQMNVEQGREFSKEKALAYLSARAHMDESPEDDLGRRCTSCHSTIAHFSAATIVDPLSSETMATRARWEEFINIRNGEPRPDSTREQNHAPKVKVLIAAELLKHDLCTTGTVSHTTNKALQLMWDAQDAGGGFPWFSITQVLGESPQADDTLWPAAMVAIAFSNAPEEILVEYESNLQKLREFLIKEINPAKGDPKISLHDRALLLASHSAIKEVLSPEQVKENVALLRQAQRPDGGWNMAMVGHPKWCRASGESMFQNRSDGYATAICILALAKTEARQEAFFWSGVRWLRFSQQDDGKWETQSPFRAGNNLRANNTGTSFAILALNALGYVPTPPTVSPTTFSLALEMGKELARVQAETVPIIEDTEKKEKERIAQVEKAREKARQERAEARKQKRAKDRRLSDTKPESRVELDPH